MGKFIITIVFIATLFFSGCITMPTYTEIATLDYGAPITVNYRAIIKDYFDTVLFDPYSAYYKIGMPQRHWYKEAPLFGNKLSAGYMVFVGVNAKNKMGGYTGMKKHGFLFKNNQIIKILKPIDFRLMKLK